MKAIERLEEAVDKLTLRERAIVSAAILSVIFGLWYLIWLMPELAERERLGAELETEAERQSQLERQIDTFEQALSGAAGEQTRRELARLEKTLSEIDAELAEVSQGLVSAERLPRLLQDVLGQTDALSLVSMRTLPVEPLELESAAAESEQADAESQSPESVGVFRHTVVVTVRGRYFEVLDFLARLEDLPWRFYWESLDYEVSDYPQGQATLRVYTLSAEEGLLGV